MTTRAARLLVVVLGYFLGLGTAQAGSLVIGRVSSDPNQTYKQLKPMVDYVASRLSDLGITGGAVLMAKNQQEMLGYLKEGRVDWVQKGVFESMHYIRLGGAELALRSWRGGVPNYYTVIFTRKDSPINSISDLLGKKIAFEDPGSTSAYFVPAAILKRAGYQLLEVTSPREKPANNVIGYAFAGDELSITTWVHRGLADAGAFHNQNWNSSRDNPDAMKQDLKIVFESKPLPRMLELFRGSLNPQIKARIKEVLLKAHEDPAAKDALLHYGPRTARFDLLVGDAKKELDEAVELERYFARTR